MLWAAGCLSWYLERTELGASHVYLDYINLMTYDANAGGRVAAHHTHLYEPKSPNGWSADSNIRLFEAEGVPASKLMLGVAFYSRRYDALAGEGDLYEKESALPCAYGPGYGEITLKYEHSSDYTKYFDDVAKAPYLCGEGSFITYDDPRSIAYKCAYVRQRNIAGAFYWEHSSDPTGILLGAMYDGLFFRA